MPPSKITSVSSTHSQDLPSTDSVLPSPDPTRTPSHRQAFPNPVPDDMSTVKEYLMSFVDSFIQTIQADSASSSVSTTVSQMCTSRGSRIPLVPITPETGRKFARLHVPASTFLPMLSHTLPVLQTSAPPPSDALPNTRRNSLIAAKISDTEKQVLLQKAEQLVRLFVSKQNQKTERLYLHFTDQVQLIPYPVDTHTLLAFLIWVAESGRFTASSIDCVLYSSICRLNVIRSGVYLDPLTQYAARAMIASLYRDPTIKQKRGGMLPLIPDDVARIITAMDMRSSLFHSLASLFTFALFIGARGNSCGSVRLRDLGPLFKADDDGGEASSCGHNCETKGQTV